MLTIRFQGLRIIATYAASEEILEEGKTLNFIKKALEEGYNAPRKRKKNTIEIWLNRGRKIYNIVAVKDYNNDLKQNVWLIIHFGKFGRK